MMKKGVITLITAAIVSTVIPAQAFAATAEVVRSVSFREGPSVSSDRIRYLQTNEVVEILDRVNKYWLKVRDKYNRVGYVTTQERYIQIKDDHNSGTGSGNATIVKSVSFRTGPSVNSHRIRYLQSGESVTILEEVNKYWYKVRDKNGTVGYVSSRPEFIRTSSGGSPAPTPSPAPQTGQAPSELARRVIEAGMKYLGTPYEFGSSRNDTRTFDCSDFVRQAFKDGAGIILPADSRQQADFVRSKGHTTTDWRKLKPGDIMFFMSYKGWRASDYAGINKSSQRITHDAIYLGDGKILHTYSQKSGGVRIDSIEGKHWEYRFIFGGSAF